LTAIIPELTAASHSIRFLTPFTTNLVPRPADSSTLTSSNSSAVSWLPLAFLFDVHNRRLGFNGIRGSSANLTRDGSIKNANTYKR